MKNRKRRKVMSIAASMILIFTAFVIGLNTSPAFAKGVNNVMGDSTLVRILQFNQERVNEGETKVGGGRVTDGQDINAIEYHKEGDVETITLHLKDALGEAASVAGAFNIQYYQYPHSIILQINGVRAFTALEDLINISGGDLVGQSYRVMTLDDSAHRFGIIFNKPVELEIIEKQLPAKLVINVKEDPTAVEAPTVYSLRTASHNFGESIGVIEEILNFQLEGNNARMIIDEENHYVVEEGYYTTEEEALARLEELKEKYDFDFSLYIEERNPSDLPKFIAE